MFTERQRIVAAVYLSGLLVGIALILFPSAGPLFTDAEFHGLSDGQFGALFLAQTVTAILSSSSVAALAARVGMKQVMLIGLAMSLLAMLAMAASQLVITTNSMAFIALIVGTACMGAGFGFIISALNAFAFDLFPGREDSAVTAVHVMTGTGQVGAALILGFFRGLEAWWGAPLMVAALVGVMIAFQWNLPLQLRVEAAANASSSERMPMGKLPARVWVYALIVFMYGAAEGTFGNWTTIFLEDEALLTMGEAALGLSIFWAAVTAGRVLFAIVAARLNLIPVYIIAPGIVGAAFVILPLLEGALASYIALGIGGLALSFFFPYSVSLASAENPANTAAVSGLLVAGIQLGNGLSANVVGQIRSADLLLGTILQASVIYALVMLGGVVYLQVVRKFKAQEVAAA